jgi:hypothetical protein
VKEHHRRALRRGAFVLSVAGISILANFGLEVVSDRFPQLGLARFTAYTHKGTT